MSRFLEVKIENFEGPLDLLLHLIYKNEMNIYDISISVITDQFISAVENMKSLDMDVAAEFIQMASYLLYLKSKMLLPNSIVDEDEMSPEEEKFLLTQRLVEYSFYKYVSEILKEREFFSSRFLKRTDEIYLPKKEEEKLNPYILAELYFNLIEKDKEVKEMSIKKDSVDISYMVNKIKEYLSKNSNLSLFSNMIKICSNKKEKVVLFLALLEMVKLKIVSVFQSENFSEIKVALYGADSGE